MLLIFEVLFGFFCPACVSMRRKNAFSPTRWAMCSLLGPLSHAADVSLTFWGPRNSSQPQDAPDNLANHTFRTLKNDLCKPNDFPFKDTGFTFPLFKLSHWFSVDLSQWKCYSPCLVNNPSFCYPGTQSRNVILCLDTTAFHILLWQRGKCLASVKKHDGVDVVWPVWGYEDVHFQGYARHTCDHI